MISCNSLIVARAMRAGLMTPSALFSSKQIATRSLSRMALAGSQGGDGSGSGRGSGGRGGGSSQGPSGGDNSGRHSRASLACLMGLSSLAMAGPAYAGKDKGKEVAQKDQKSAELTVDSVTDMLWELAGPILTNLGFSGCIGVAAGLALKKVGQMVAVFIGLAFAALQGLAYTGAITVNWSNIQDRVVKTLDANNDGKLDKEDFKLYSKQALGVLTYGVPSVGGFLGGFLLGLKM